MPQLGRNYQLAALRGSVGPHSQFRAFSSTLVNAVTGDVLVGDLSGFVFARHVRIGVWVSPAIAFYNPPANDAAPFGGRTG
jgi:hypothetical protein